MTRVTAVYCQDANKIMLNHVSDYSKLVMSLISTNVVRDDTALVTDLDTYLYLKKHHKLVTRNSSILIVSSTHSLIPDVPSDRLFRDLSELTNTTDFDDYIMFSIYDTMYQSELITTYKILTIVYSSLDLALSTVNLPMDIYPVSSLLYLNEPIGRDIVYTSYQREGTNA